MADVLGYRREKLGVSGRAIAWAHNAHLQRVPLGDVRTGTKVFGMWLAERYGARYAPIMLTGYDVQDYWPGLKIEMKALPSDGAIEHEWHKLHYPYLFVDPAKYFTSDAPKLFHDGAPIAPSAFHRIVYLDHSPAMTYVD
jgi:hypothetical protein